MLAWCLHVVYTKAHSISTQRQFSMFLILISLVILRHFSWINNMVRIAFCVLVLLLNVSVKASEQDTEISHKNVRIKFTASANPEDSHEYSINLVNKSQHIKGMISDRDFNPEISVPIENIKKDVFDCLMGTFVSTLTEEDLIPANVSNNANRYLQVCKRNNPSINPLDLLIASDALNIDLNSDEKNQTFNKFINFMSVICAESLKEGSLNLTYDKDGQTSYERIPFHLEQKVAGLLMHDLIKNGEGAMVEKSYDHKDQADFFISRMGSTQRFACLAIPYTSARTQQSKTQNPYIFVPHINRKIALKKPFFFKSDKMEPTKIPPFRCALSKDGRYLLAIYKSEESITIQLHKISEEEDTQILINTPQEFDSNYEPLSILFNEKNNSFNILAYSLQRDVSAGTIQKFYRYNINLDEPIIVITGQDIDAPHFKEIKDVCWSCIEGTIIGVYTNHDAMPHSIQSYALNDTQWSQCNLDQDSKKWTHSKTNKVSIEFDIIKAQEKPLALNFAIVHSFIPYLFKLLKKKFKKIKDFPLVCLSSSVFNPHLLLLYGVKSQVQKEPKLVIVHPCNPDLMQEIYTLENMVLNNKSGVLTKAISVYNNFCIKPSLTENSFLSSTTRATELVTSENTVSSIVEQVITPQLVTTTNPVTTDSAQSNSSSTTSTAVAAYKPVTIEIAKKTESNKEDFNLIQTFRRGTAYIYSYAHASWQSFYNKYRAPFIATVSIGGIGILALYLKKYNKQVGLPSLTLKNPFDQLHKLNKSVHYD